MHNMNQGPLMAPIFCGRCFAGYALPVESLKACFYCKEKTPSKWLSEAELANLGKKQTEPRPEGKASTIWAYEAPWLQDRMIADKVVQDPEEFVLLFREFKRYAILATKHGPGFPMFSPRVDAVWHQFILFTRNYADFCRDHLGKFLHHAPASKGEVAAFSLHEFRQHYEVEFGRPIPAVWPAPESPRESSCNPPSEMYDKDGKHRCDDDDSKCGGDDGKCGGGWD